jgi:hypothetical protein
MAGIIQSREQALKICDDKYDAGLFVGTLNEVWTEAHKRARANGKDRAGRINTSRQTDTTILKT